MDMQLIAYAIPIFIVLMLIEYFYGVAKKHNTYCFGDSINSLSTGILMTLFSAVTKSIQIVPFYFVYEYFRIIDYSLIPGWEYIAPLIFFILVDFCYYWAHRVCHEVNFLWGVHQPHHQSEAFNLSTALRQGAFQGLFTAPFYVPLAILGCDPLLFLALAALNTLYQFWVHTRHIKSCGWLEYILVTPSHHRVHHGRNELYLDKNYSGVFIVWDKLFNTFEKETVEPVYGVTTPINTLNPYKANMSWWALLYQDMKCTDSIIEKIKLWFMPTGWRPQTAAAQFDYPAHDGDDNESSYQCISLPLKIYCLVQFALLIGLTFYLLIKWETLSVLAVSIGLVLIGLGLYTINGLQEEKNHAVYVEIVRCLSFVAWLLTLHHL